MTLEALPTIQLSAAGAAQLPYLRRARIPAATYMGQDAAIETASIQVVLAAPAPEEGARTHIGGLIAALRGGGIRLSFEEPQALLQAGLAGEMPDPVLPLPWSLRPLREREISDKASALVETTLNVAAWAFLVALSVLLLPSLRSRQRSDQSNLRSD